MKEMQRAIGVFDSGVGGLTVLRSLTEHLPKENYFYFGDTARFPYGMKSPEQLRSFTFEIIGFLKQLGIKIAVIACNSASSAALTQAQAHFEIPVIGVIEPGARSAVIGSRTRRIGVIGSNATVKSDAYKNAILNLDAGAQVFQAACPELADFAEKGETDSEALMQVLEGYLEPLKAHRIDSLILGCTHYPILSKAIAKVAGADVALISSAEETAKELEEILMKREILNNMPASVDAAPLFRRFFSTNHSEKLHLLSEKFFGSSIDQIERVELSKLSILKY